MKPEVRIGSFLSSVKISISMVEINLYPSDLVNYWSRCGLLADFGASFYAFCFPNNKSAQNSLSFILNEIIENAVKYSINKNNPIKICLYQLQDDLIFEVENDLSFEQASVFKGVIEHLQSISDIEAEYMAAIQNNMDKEKVSGMGLLTILNDFNLDMAFDFFKKEERDSVNVQVKITPEDISA